MPKTAQSAAAVEPRQMREPAAAVAGPRRSREPVEAAEQEAIQARSELQRNRMARTSAMTRPVRAWCRRFRPPAQPERRPGPEPEEQPWVRPAARQPRRAQAPAESKMELRRGPPQGGTGWRQGRKPAHRRSKAGSDCRRGSDRSAHIGHYPGRIPIPASTRRSPAPDGGPRFRRRPNRQPLSRHQWPQAARARLPHPQTSRWRCHTNGRD